MASSVAITIAIGFTLTSGMTSEDSFATVCRKRLSRNIAEA
jgi:hypothetical protein